MHRRAPSLAAALLLVTVPVAGTVGAAHEPVEPITNGHFEVGTAPEEVSQLITGPVDTCVGIGHQVFWGDDSPQHVLLGDEQDPEPRPSGPAELAAAYADGDRDAAQDAERQSGVGHCVSSEERGKDAAWITPKGRTMGAEGWSTPLPQESATRFGFDFDADPFDREARIDHEPGKSDHNLWQVQDQQKAFTLDFQTLEFALEGGTISSSDPAHVEVGFSLSPGYAQHPFVGLFWEGGLNFRADDMTVDGDGFVGLDPVADSVAEGDINCPDGADGGPYTPCIQYRENVTDAYAQGDTERVRDLLGQVRIVQVSFWGFNKVSGGVVLDDISIKGATTAAEELADGNVNVNPLPE